MSHTSDVMGVCWMPSAGRWVARTIHKKVLYRGLDKGEAEKARLAYDAGKLKGPVVRRTGNKPKEIFKGAFQPVWMPSIMFEAKFGA